MGRRALGKRKEMEEVDPRAAQAGSPIALTLFDLLADPTSTLRNLLRVSDLFCVRLTCKEAWRCIQHRPLTKLGVLRAAKAPRGYGRGFDHHVPLLRWCLRNIAVDLDLREECFITIGEAGDVELVSELLEVEPKTAEVMGDLLTGAARAGHDELALQLWADFVKLSKNNDKKRSFDYSVVAGGCVRTAAAIDSDPTAWVRDVSYAMRNGHQRFVKWVLADVEPDADGDYVAQAARSGSLELVQWLYAKGHVVGEDSLVEAVSSGNVELCKWVLDHGLVPDEGAMEAAVERGHVEVLEWLSSMGCMCTSELLSYAVREGGVPVVGWCLDNHPHPPDAGDLLVLSCQNVHGTEVFEYLADQRGFQSSPTGLMRAAQMREVWTEGMAFDAAILVKRYNIPLYSDYLWEAAHLQDLDRLRFALSQGQEVLVDSFRDLIIARDATLLNEVLLARKVRGRITPTDRTRIMQALREVACRTRAKKVLAEHSIVV
jgi:hypothetical protein